LRFGSSRNNSSLKAGVLIKFPDIKSTIPLGKSGTILGMKG